MSVVVASRCIAATATIALAIPEAITGAIPTRSPTHRMGWDGMGWELLLKSSVLPVGTPNPPTTTNEAKPKSHSHAASFYLPGVAGCVRRWWGPSGIVGRSASTDLTTGGTERHRTVAELAGRVTP